MDLLIHDATFDDSKARDAKLKTHSTFGQAMDVGEKCLAKFTVLTHFSNQYSRIPSVTERLLQADKVGVAFDNMVVSYYLCMPNRHEPISPVQ